MPTKLKKQAFFGQKHNMTMRLWAQFDLGRTGNLREHTTCHFLPDRGRIVDAKMRLVQSDERGSVGANFQILTGYRKEAN